MTTCPKGWRRTTRRLGTVRGIRAALPAGLREVFRDELDQAIDTGDLAVLTALKDRWRARAAWRAGTAQRRSVELDGGKRTALSEHEGDGGAPASSPRFRQMVCCGWCHVPPAGRILPADHPTTAHRPPRPTVADDGRACVPAEQRSGSGRVQLPLFAVRHELAVVGDVRGFDRWAELALRRAERTGDFECFHTELRNWLRAALCGRPPFEVAAAPYEQRVKILDRLEREWIKQHPPHTNFA